MHRKLWADAPFGGIGRAVLPMRRGSPIAVTWWTAMRWRRPACPRRFARACVGECVGGFGGGAPRNVGAHISADGWSDVHDRTVRMDRACRCDALPPGALGDVAARYGDATSDWRGATTGAGEV